LTLEELVVWFAKHPNVDFFHFTDVANLESIQKHGILSMREVQRLGIDAAPGGNEISLTADKYCGMDAYVHLCFRKNHPMQYKGSKDGRSFRWLKIDPAVIILDGVKLTDQVSNKTGVVPGDPMEMFRKLDWEVLWTRMVWQDPAVKARLDVAEKWEILVPNVVPLKYIRSFNG
jgi:hypothetical protein